MGGGCGGFGGAGGGEKNVEFASTPLYRGTDVEPRSSNTNRVMYLKD